MWIWGVLVIVIATIFVADLGITILRHRWEHGEPAPRLVRSMREWWRRCID